MPDNFYLLGTMNTADRTIAILDFAVRRRFAFIDVWPSAERLQQIYGMVILRSEIELLNIII